MARSLITLLAVSAVVLACGRPAMQPRVSPEEVALRDVREVARSHAGEPVQISLPASPLAAAAPAMRNVGDFVVYRFSGSYRDEPLTVALHVDARDANSTTVQMSVDKHGEVLRLQLRLSERAANLGEVVSVSRLEGDVQRPYGLAAYQQLMSEIVVAAGDGAEPMTEVNTQVELGSRTFNAQRKRYRVRVGAHEAIQETISSPVFLWADIGGQIQTLDGNLLYKSEIIDVGGSGFGAPQVASQVIEDDEPDYDFE